MVKAKRQKSWSNTERFWNLYMAFCYPMNESKLLKPQYDGKVKMIYIDPPYNTGNAFIYNDKFIAQNEMYSRFLLGKIPQLRKADEL